MGQTRDSGQFDGDGGSFAAADAQRGDAALQLAALERMHERGDDARARSPDRMTEGAGAAVDVDLFVRQTDIAHRRHGDHRERFVDLVQIHIRRPPRGRLQHALDRTAWGGREPFRLVRMAGIGDNARQRRNAGRAHRGLAHEHQRRRTIGDRGGTRRSDRAILVEGWFELRDFIDIAAVRSFIPIDDLLALAALDRHRDQFGAERAALAGCECAADRFGREGILLGTRATNMEPTSSPAPSRKPALAFGSRYGALVIDSKPPATTTRAEPARIASQPIITAFMPEPQTLLMVVAGTRVGTPAPIAAWRAGAWPTPAGSTQPSSTSSTCSPRMPLRSSAPRTAAAPSCGAVSAFRTP